MISENKYVGEAKKEPLIIRSVGANNCDAVIIENGEYEVEPPFTGFGKVTVMVEQSPSGSLVGWIPKNVNGDVLENSGEMIDLTGIREIAGNSTLANVYYENNIISGTIDMSGIQLINGSMTCYNMFCQNINITGVDLSSLKKINGYHCCNSMFSSCNITSIDLSSLEEISGNYACQYMFYTNFDLAEVNMSALKKMGSSSCSSMFAGCINLTSIVFNSLSSIASRACEYMFSDCTSLQTISFPALTSTSFGRYKNQFNFMLLSVNGCVVHFPSNLESVIGEWADVLDGFGGINTVVLFDLPETE